MELLKNVLVSNQSVILMKDQEDEKPQTIHKLSNFYFPTYLRCI